MTRKKTYPTVTDLFCGAGGSSQGAVKAGAEVSIAVNHWRLAVETHATNFPKTAHDCADISQADPRRYPTTDILIASPECTNHSLAKGRRRIQHAQLDMFNSKAPDPSEERSRATMWDVPRFAEYHDYRAIIVENVVDARHWRLWDAWLQAMHLLGYEHRVVYANSMFHLPTPQSRDRMYVFFWKGIPKPNLDYRPQGFCARCEKVVNAVQSWKNQARKWGRYGKRNQYIYCCPTCGGEAHPYYYPAAAAIDWAIPGERIGDRKTPLKPRTMERIRYGLEKFGGQPMAVQLDYTHSQTNRAWPVTKALPTQTSRQVMALVAPFLIQYYTRHYGQAVSGIEQAMPGVNTEPRHALIQPPFLIPMTHGQDRMPAVDEAMPTQTASELFALTTPPFLTSVNHTSERARSTDEPTPTVMTETTPSLVVPPFTVELYNTSKVNGIDDPASTMTAGGVHQGLLVPFLTSYYGSGAGAAPVTGPAATVTTHDRQALIAPQVDAEDCFFRMLKPHEIGRAMAFPDDYVVLGNSRDKVRQYGNAVTPPVMDWGTAAVMESLA